MSGLHHFARFGCRLNYDAGGIDPELGVADPIPGRLELGFGRIHLRAGRAADAVEALKISIWSEDSAAAHLVLAQAYLSMKNGGAARSEAQKALKLDPESAEARRLLETIK